MRNSAKLLWTIIVSLVLAWLIYSQGLRMKENEYEDHAARLLEGRKQKELELSKQTKPTDEGNQLGKQP